MPKHQSTPSKRKQKFIVFDPSKDSGQADRGIDIIIPVMGKTGSGKSTFVNTIPCDKKMEIGHGLLSCTQRTQTAIVEPEFVSKCCPELQHRRIILVDTPGFGQTSRTDYDVLKEISYWLASCYRDGIKLAGIVYLYDVTQPRLDRDGLDDLQVFAEICGNDALKSAVLGTTKWTRENKEQEERARELEKIWQDMIKHDSQIMRIKRNEESGEVLRTILARFLQQSGNDYVLKIQEELAIQSKAISKTSAGQAVRQQEKKAKGFLAKLGKFFGFLR